MDAMELIFSFSLFNYLATKAQHALMAPLHTLTPTHNVSYMYAYHARSNNICIYIL